MIGTSLESLWFGFGVALEPHNLMFCLLGVVVGNMVGVLPGMGPLATISILLPLTFGMKPVAAILMLGGVMYGAQYGGAICSILLNLPCHPPHAVTCLDGFPMTKQGRGGVALGLTVFASFVGASWGITEMVFLSPLLVRAALQFGPAEVCSLMLLGLLAGSTLARGSPVKGVAMTVVGLFLGSVGTDLETGSERYTFGMTELDDGVELIALALGLFGIAEFMNSVNQVAAVNLKYTNIKFKDMRPTKADMKRAFFPMWLSAGSPAGPAYPWQVAALEPGRFLGLRGLTDLHVRRLDPAQPRPPAYGMGRLWGFLLTELPGDRTRLVQSGYQSIHPRWLERLINFWIHPPVHSTDRPASSPTSSATSNRPGGGNHRATNGDPSHTPPVPADQDVRDEFLIRHLSQYSERTP